MTMQLHAIEVGHCFQQRRNPTPLPQQVHGLRKLHLVIQLREANHVAAARAAVTVEQVPAGVQQKAWFVIGVQRTQPHEATAPDAPGGMPAVCLQVFQQRYLLFQLIERFSIHELSASTGRIRLSAFQSQARMVGGTEVFHPAPAHIAIDTRTPRANNCQLQRRTVDGSGNRSASLTSGTDCSQLLA
jgi:hypothetical protein